MTQCVGGHFAAFKQSNALVFAAVSFHFQVVFANTSTQDLHQHIITPILQTSCLIYNSNNYYT